MPNKKIDPNLKLQYAMAHNDQFFYWSYLYWYTHRQDQLDFKTHPYLKELFFDYSPYIVFKKAAQVGISEYLLALAFYVADKKRGNVGYFFPASSQMGDFVQTRVDPVIEKSDYIRRRTKRESGGAAKSADKLGLKKVGDGFIYFRGAQNPRQITSIPLDCAILDEYDRFDRVSIAMIEKRLRHSDLGWIRNASTPTTEGYGIDIEYEESTQNEWFVKCPKCKKIQTIDFFRNVNKEKVQVECVNCRLHFPYSVIATGKWMPKKPMNKKQGYYIHGLLSPYIDLTGIIKNINSPNQFRKQEAYNQDLGLAFEASDILLSDKTIAACRGDYSMPVSNGIVKKTVAGVDVGKPSYMTVLSPHQGKPRLIATIELQDLERDYAYWAKYYGIGMTVIDAAPETNTVARMVQEHFGIVHLAYYDYQKTSDGEIVRWDDSAVHIHRTASLDDMYGRIFGQEIILPANILQNTDFIQHLKNLKRVPAMIRNQMTFVYEDKGRPDHFAHSLNYALVAYSNLPAEMTDQEDQEIFDKKGKRGINDGSMSSYKKHPLQSRFNKSF